jgi:hypothetical protein
MKLAASTASSRVVNHGILQHARSAVIMGGESQQGCMAGVVWIVSDAGGSAGCTCCGGIRFVGVSPTEFSGSLASSYSREM